MMLFLILTSAFVIFCNVNVNTVATSPIEERIVSLKQGRVRGFKDENGDFMAFYGIPYASTPLGKDRFKAPKPPPNWTDIFNATKKISCPQVYADDTQEDCLVVNIYIPINDNQSTPKDGGLNEIDRQMTEGAESNLNIEKRTEKSTGNKTLLETNLTSNNGTITNIDRQGIHEEQNTKLAVLVYVHSGGFLSNGATGGWQKYLKHDVIIVEFQYRLGALGFLNLGTEDAPGNAALKDQVAAFKWVKGNIGKFDGDTEAITAIGSSAGAATLELLIIANKVGGLFKRAILDSGSALASFAIADNSLELAKTVAINLGFKDVDDMSALVEFYKSATAEDLAYGSELIIPTGLRLEPSIETWESDDGILYERPIDLFVKAEYEKVPILIGYSTKDGTELLLHLTEKDFEKFDRNFSELLPANLNITSEEVISAAKSVYFGDKKVSDSLSALVDWYTDIQFKIPSVMSAGFHIINSDNPTFFYEYAYANAFYGDVMRHGASHTTLIRTLFTYDVETEFSNDLIMIDRMMTMLTNFVKSGEPTPHVTTLLPAKWIPASKGNFNNLHIDIQMEMREDLADKRLRFWREVFDKYYGLHST